MWKMSSKYYPNRSIMRALFSKRTVCYMARLIKRLSSQYFEDICVLLIGGVCRKCPLNTAKPFYHAGLIAVRGQCADIFSIYAVLTKPGTCHFGAGSTQPKPTYQSVRANL